jgi:hypothetical protein
MTPRLRTRVAGLTVAAAAAGAGPDLHAQPPEPAPVPVSRPADAAVTERDVTEARLRLLESRRVQRELGMTPEQRARLLDGLDAVLRERCDLFGLIELLQANDRGVPAWLRDYDAMHRAYELRQRALAASVLTRRQFDRLLQVEVRLMEEFAPLDPRVAGAMKLSPEQAVRVRAVLRRNEGVDLGNQAPPPFEDLLRLVSPREMRGLVERELTAEQRRVWGELAGERMRFEPEKARGEFSVRGRYEAMLRPELLEVPGGKGGAGR